MLERKIDYMSIRPTFMGFETAKRGLQINQKALDVVSHNVANIGVTGYTRQRADQVSLHYNGMPSRYAESPVNLAGQGSMISGVAQLRDPYLDKRFRQENSDIGYYGKNVNILTDIETSLDEYSHDGIKTALTKVFSAVSSLHTLTNPTNANILRTACKSLTNVVEQYGRKLDNIKEQQREDLSISVDEVNTILNKIVNLNNSISKDVFVAAGITNNYYGPSELLDERNLLIDQLSQYSDIEVITKPGNTVEIMMGGKKAISVDSNGVSSSLSLAYVVDHNKDTTHVQWSDTGKDIDSSSGSLIASINMLNGEGPEAFGAVNVERGIPYYKRQMDMFASRFADVFNHTIPKFDEQGKPIENEFLTLFTTNDGKITGINSNDFKISEEWDNDPNFIIIENSINGAFDNTYYQVMLDKLNGEHSFGDFSTEFSGTFEEFIKNYATTLGEDITFHSGRMKASQAVGESVLDSIAAVSGVNMDEEGADMMAYQKIYSAMSRMMTVMDEALDTLINRTGVVGR